MMYLDKTQPGRLLDIGCGNGKLLARMVKRGWQVEGQEVDAEAAAATRARYGFTVHLGPLRALNLPEASFDAIVLKHVIEHLPDPESLLAECCRLLRPGGQLLLATPNIDSLGHRLFGASWRGLEPPRHLHLFSDQTLRTLGERCGFTKLDVWTVSASAGRLAAASLAAGRSAPSGLSGRFSLTALAFGAQLLANLTHLFDKSSGDECVLRAIK